MHGAASQDRVLVNEAYEILSDDSRRKAYDAGMRERRMRALASGGEPARVRPAGAAPAAPGRGTRTALTIALVLAAVASTWIYLDHQRKAELLRLAREQLAAEERRKAAHQQRLEENARRHGQSLEWAKARHEEQQQLARERQAQAQRDRERRQHDSEQHRARAMELAEQRRRDAEAQRAEHERLRREQEDIRRAQQQLERERMMLREAERDRGVRF